MQQMLTAVLLLIILEFNAQTKPLNNIQPLTAVLSHIEDKFHCRFTYADEVVRAIYISPLPQDLSLKETLAFLQQQSGLIFNILTPRQIVIVAPERSYLFCGYLLDSQTNQPVNKAVIRIQGRYVLSDNKGYFAVRLMQSTANLWIYHQSYKTTSKQINYKKGFACPKIYLNPKINILSTVFLQNIIAEGIHKQINGATEINLKKFGILPGLIEPDVLQTLQALPAVKSVDEKVSNINIRGGTNDQNLILWDGIRLYQTGHFFGLITAVNPNMVNKVTLIEDGTSASYTNAVSGTVLMTSKQNIPKDIEANAGVNFINTDIWVNIPLGQKSGLEIGARKAISQFLETPTYTKYYERILQNTEVNNQSLSESNTYINFDFYDFALKYLYRPTSKDLLQLNWMYISDNFNYNKNAVLAGLPQEKAGALQQDNMAEGLYWEHNWNANFKSYVQIYETDYKLEAQDSDLTQPQTLDQSNTVSETSVKAWTTYQINPQMYWTNGYQFLENGTGNLTKIDQPRIINYVKEVMREHAVFSQLHTDWKNHKFKMLLGLRQNYLEKTNSFLFEPRFHLNYKFNTYWHMALSGELKHQFISQIINFQTDFLGIEKRRWRLSNGRDVPVIKSKNVSFGITFNKHGWLFSAEVYYKDVQGITAQSQGFVNQYMYTQAIGAYQVTGVDILLNKRGRYFSTWLSYAYAHNFYTFEDFEEPYFPNNWALKHTFTTGLTYHYQALQTSIGLNWHSGKPTTLPDTDQPVNQNSINFDQANAVNLPDYLRLDWSANYKFKLSDHLKMQVGASIWNLTARTNILSRYYRLDENQNLIEYQQKSLGFTPNLSVRLAWN